MLLSFSFFSFTYSEVLHCAKKLIRIFYYAFLFYTLFMFTRQNAFICVPSSRRMRPVWEVTESESVSKVNPLRQAQFSI